MIGLDFVLCTQIRATDRLYGLISGRELSFPQQVVMALDRYKDIILDKLTIWMISTIARHCDYRAPHLLNRLRVQLADDLGNLMIKNT